MAEATATGTTGTEEWQPKIVMFCCNWCSYGGADSAGMGRFQQPPTVRVIRVMCSGRMDPVFILNAFLEGADGVLFSGCHIGDCHYVNGNYKATVKYKFLKAMVNELGIEDERLKLDWISASEGERYAEVVTEFTEQIKKVGPSPLKPEGVI